MRLIRLLTLLVALTPAVVRGQSMQSGSALASYDSVFFRTFRAYDRHDWRELSRLAHPAALAQYRDAVLGMQRSVAEASAIYGEQPIRKARAERRAQFEALSALTPESLFVAMAWEQIDRYHRFEDRPSVVRQVVGHAFEGEMINAVSDGKAPRR